MKTHGINPRIFVQKLQRLHNLGKLLFQAKLSVVLPLNFQKLHRHVSSKSCIRYADLEPKLSPLSSFLSSMSIEDTKSLCNRSSPSVVIFRMSNSN